jgi:hypothetical protein
MESLPQYAEQVRVALKDYLSGIEKWLTGPGDYKKQRDGFTRAHVEWLVQRQVFGLKAEDIIQRWADSTDDDDEKGKRLGISIQAVTKAQRDIAGEIGLPLREVLRG